MSCDCRVSAEARSRAHHHLVSEIERARCAATPEPVLLSLYLRDPSVLSAVLDREHIPARVLGKCIDPALAHTQRDNGHLPPRPDEAVARILTRPELTVANLRKIAEAGNLHPRTLLAVATHPLCGADLLPVLAIGLYEWTGVGWHDEGTTALRAGFGLRALAARHLSRRHHGVSELREQLEELDGLGEGALDLYGGLCGTFLGDDEALRAVVGALAAKSVGITG